jgi:hypothetical protein
VAFLCLFVGQIGQKLDISDAVLNYPLPLPIEAIPSHIPVDGIEKESIFTFDSIYKAAVFLQ